MANSTKSSNSSKSTSSSSSRRSGFWGLNKISMYTLVAVALLYVVSLILSCVGISLKTISILNGVATAIMIIIVAILAWRYVRSKQMVWKVLYVLCLLLVIVGVVIPLVI